MDHKPRTESQSSSAADAPLSGGTGASPLPWAIAFGLAVLCLAGWLLGFGTRLPAAKPFPQSFLFILGFFRYVLWPFAVAAVIFLAGASAGAAVMKLVGALPHQSRGTALRSSSAQALRVSSVQACRVPTTPRGAFEGLLFATAIGVGISSYATLALGMLGLLSTEVFWALIGVLLLVGGRRLAAMLAGALGQGRQWISSWGWFEWAVALGGAALLVVGLLCSSTPVLDYDTLEYHLGAPGEYFAAGGVRFLSHNVYANFPAHVEMLYLQGIALCGSKSGGMAAAILIQVLFGALAAGAVGVIAARCVVREAPRAPESIGRGNAGLLAAVFFLTCPLLVVTVLRAHITLARCFYGTMALLAVMEWIYPRAEGASARRSYLILGGVCCGLAVAVKYSALLLLCAPLGAAVLLVSIARNGTWARRLAPPAVLAGCALLAVLPWLVRNMAATGNPVFPLLYEVFGAEGWTAQQAAKFARAHAAPLSLGRFLLETWRFLCGYTGAMSPGFAGPLAVLFIPVLLVGAFWRKGGPKMGQSRAHFGPILFLICYGAVMVVLWGVATHQIARFLAPLLVVLSVLSAAGFCVAARSRAGGRVCRVVVLLGVAYSIYAHVTLAYAWGGLGGTLGGEGLLELSQRVGGTEYAQAVHWINDKDNVPPGGAVMLVGEARIYYFDRRLLYSVVFNDHPIEPALQLAGDDLPRAVTALQATGATHVLVNWFELRRLSTSYSYTYEGRRLPGYLPQLDLQTRQPLLRLLNASGRRVQTFGLMRWPDRDSPQEIPVIEIYELRR